jgi:hypothetical protein
VPAAQYIVARGSSPGNERAGPLRHVALHGNGASTFTGDLAHHPFRAFMIVRIVNNHCRAFRAESICNASSDSF